MSHSEDPQPHVVANGVTPGSIVRCRNRDWVLLAVPICPVIIFMRKCFYANYD